jgi:hypothetical protein
MKLRGALLSLWCLAACVSEDKTLTQVIVEVDAEPGIREQASQLVVSIYGSDGISELAGSLLRHEQTVDAPAYPLRVAIAPLGGDVDRLFLIQVRGQTRRGELVAEARLISGYTRGGRRETRMLLEDACAGVICEDRLQTCRNKRCVDARDDFAFESSGESDHTPDASKARDARVRDATSGARDEDASSLPAPREDAGEPAIDEPDAGPTGEPDAATPVKVDAGGAVPDAGAVTNVDAGPPTTPVSKPSKLPTYVRECPTLADGTVTFTGLGDVRIWRNAAADPTKRGPLVIHWHAVGTTTNDAANILGEGIQQITSEGGIVAAPVASTKQGNDINNGVWYTGDVIYADRIVACAIAQGLPIDTRRIHTTGISVGGAMAATLSYARSDYIASFVSNSGGFVGTANIPTLQDATHVPEGLVVHGGSTIDVVLVNWATASQALVADMKSKGGYVIACDHGGGHGGPTGASSWEWPFLRAHSYKQQPHPYAAGLPGEFPAYCVLP